MIYIYQSGDAFSVSTDKASRPAMFGKLAPRVYADATEAYRIETFGRIRDALKLLGADDSNPVAQHHTSKSLAAPTLRPSVTDTNQAERRAWDDSHRFSGTQQYSRFNYGADAGHGE